MPRPGTATSGPARHRHPWRLDPRALLRGRRPRPAEVEAEVHGRDAPVRARPAQVEQVPAPRPAWDGPLPAWAGPAVGPHPADDVPPALALPPVVEASPAVGVLPAVVPRLPGVRPGPAPRAAVEPASPSVVPSPRPAAAPAAAPAVVPPDGVLPPRGPAVHLTFSDGRTLVLTGTALVGRDPAPRVGESPGTLVAVPDPGRSVSKTHLGVGVDAAGAWVVDRQSTNGTVVMLPDGQQILCVPERRVRLTPGSSVAFGDHGFVLAAP